MSDQFKQLVRVPNAYTHNPENNKGAYQKAAVWGSSDDDPKLNSYPLYYMDAEGGEQELTTVDQSGAGQIYYAFVQNGIFTLSEDSNVSIIPYIKTDGTDDPVSFCLYDLDNGKVGNPVNNTFKTSAQYMQGGYLEVQNANDINKIKSEGLIYETERTYKEGARVQASDNDIYVSKEEQKGNDPVTGNAEKWDLAANISKVLAKNTIKPRNLADRFSDIVNAFDFGVVNDINIDVTEKIQEAILSLASKGGIVFVPAGDFKVSSFYVPAGVTLQGCGDKTVFHGNNESNYTISSAPLSIIKNIAMNGTDSSGWGLQVSNDCIIDDVNIYQYKGTENEEDGTGLLLEGAYSSTFNRVRVKNCRTDCTIGKKGTSKENNAIGFYNCKFEFSELPGVLVNKANVINFYNVIFGHHGGVDGSSVNGIALSVQNTGASINIDGFYSEFCSIGILNEGKLIAVKNGRFSNKVVVNSGTARVEHSEFYGFAGFVDCPSGSTGFAILENNWGDSNAPIIGPENYQGRVTRLRSGAGFYEIRNGLNVTGGKDLSLKNGGNLIVDGGVIRSTASSGSAIGAFNGGNITVGLADFECTDASKGLVLKAANNSRYRITVDNSGNLKTTAI